MPKIIGPLFSESASGSVSPVLTFSRRKSGQQVRYQRKQKDVLTADRITARSAYSMAVASWNLLSLAEKNYYNVLAVGKHMTGYNLYMQLNIGLGPLDTTAFYGTRLHGVCIYGTED